MCNRKAEEDVNRLTLQPRTAYSSLYLFIKGIKELQVKGQKRDYSYPGACDKIALENWEWNFKKFAYKIKR